MGDKTQSYIEKDRPARAVPAPSRPTQWPKAVWRRAKCISPTSWLLGAPEDDGPGGNSSAWLGPWAADAPACLHLTKRKRRRCFLQDVGHECPHREGLVMRQPVGDACHTLCMSETRSQEGEGRGQGLGSWVQTMEASSEGTRLSGQK